MSREIKFRAWNKEKKIMCYDNEDNTEEYFDGINSTEIGFINHRLSIPKDDSDWYFRSRYDVMQYTGLKDKNGKEIYEGDIVEYNDFNSLRTGGHAEDKFIVGKVAFSCGMWMVEEKNCGHDLYEGLVNDEELEVIGNIYENPELLEATA
ncbi:YopX family protein [Lysinibacillus fusiformis]|uniref:YopX family protein n=1 Tax=Lysinibacillus fusiformis TaxID=28031 RepID=UPI00148DB53D|nr:YopX family protein [Lysinibacillus fusiformis]NOG28548.1 hypothetical protein [Lysinibacillus fusiformis]